MAILSLAEIMEADDVTEKTVPVPEWGGEVIVKSLSHRAMREIRKSLSVEGEDDDVDENELEKWVFVKGMVSPTVTPEEYERLMDKSTGAIQKVLTAILGSSKMGEEAVKDAEKSVSAESVGDVPVQPLGESGNDGGTIAYREEHSTLAR